LTGRPLQYLLNCKVFVLILVYKLLLYFTYSIRIYAHLNGCKMMYLDPQVGRDFLQCQDDQDCPSILDDQDDLVFPSDLHVLGDLGFLCHLSHLHKQWSKYISQLPSFNNTAKLLQTLFEHGA